MAFEDIAQAVDDYKLEQQQNEDSDKALFSTNYSFKDFITNDKIVISAILIFALIFGFPIGTLNQIQESTQKRRQGKPV